MTKNELGLIRLFLDASPENLFRWYQRATDQDLIHAVELMERYAAHLENEIVFQCIEEQIAEMPVLVQAQAVIAAVRG